jgi:hypothetical protein
MKGNNRSTPRIPPPATTKLIRLVRTHHGHFEITGRQDIIAQGHFYGPMPKVTETD